MRIDGYRYYEYTTICQKCGAVITYLEEDKIKGGFMNMRDGINCPHCGKFIAHWHALPRLRAHPCLPPIEVED